MKTYKHLYDTCISEFNIQIAIQSIKRSKRIKSIIKKKHLSDDALLSEIHKWIINYRNSYHTPIYITDGLNGKKRTIFVPTLEELAVQHCVVNALKPMFYKGMYEHSYASIPNRGQHKGKKVIEKWIKHDRKNTKYVLKMDIYHFFDSVSHNILKAKLLKKIKDENMLQLLFEIIDIIDVGLPLGFYTSQWLSNWYLQDLDHYIKEQLHAVYYIRYMDDMVIFSNNKKVLHKIRKSINDYLVANLDLQLKSNWQVFRFSHIDNEGREKGRDLDFMGFRFFCNRTIIRKSIMHKATRKAKKLFNKQKITIYDSRQMLSYLGWIKCTDSYSMYTEWIKKYVKFQKLKRIVSRHDRNNITKKYLNFSSFYKGGNNNGIAISLFRKHN